MSDLLASKCIIYVYVVFNGEAIYIMHIHKNLQQISAGLVKTNLYKNSLGTNVDSPIYKTLVSLSVDDITEAIEYLLCTPSNVVV